jgi:hydrogenase/urease accessory protein HupE
MNRIALVLAILVWGLTRGLAHEVRPAYLGIHQTGSDTYDVIWKVPALGDQLRLGLYVAMPPESVELSPPRGSFANNAFIETWTVRRKAGLEGSSIRISGLAATLTDALLRFERLDGTVQVARLTPSSPSVVVEGSPAALQVASTYLKLGIEHILFGYDHLLFLLALLIIVGNAGRLAATVTAFTLAHSITLALAALAVVHVPQPPTEAAIALSIVFVAAEAIKLGAGRTSLTVRYPWLVAFVFGLLHGFGFAGALLEIGLPQKDVPLALLTFNLGVELGQLLFIGAVLAVAAGWRASVYPTFRTRSVQPLVAYAIGVVATFWLIERLSAFTAFQ